MIHPGLLLQNRYQVLQPLGKGGFGQTFEVDDGGIVKVLKVLNLERFYTRETYQKAISLFQREAAVLSRLNHPGIPRVEPDGYFTLAEDSGEILYCLVMEKIDGINLKKWMRSRDNQPITQEQAIAWLEQLADILTQLHQQDLIHRDIKPSNILLKPNGQLVLIDFGAVREITDTYLQKQAKNVTGTVIISVGYTPPEQAEGQSVPQSDFFALGRTLVYLLTGQHPTDFNKDTRTGKLSWRDGAAQVSTEFAGLIDYLMATFPGNRPQTPRMIRRCLKDITTPLLALADTPNDKSSTASASVTHKEQSFPAKTSSSIPKISPTNPWQKVQLRRTLSGHKDIVRAVAITPDGQIMVSGSYDKTIRLWELPSGKLLRTLSGHTHRVTCIATSPDGRLLVSSSYDRTIKLWELPSGELQYTFPRHSGIVRYIAFSPDGQTLISTSDSEIKLWVVGTSQLLRPLTGGLLSARIGTFSPDGKTCIIGRLDGNLELWNPYSGERLRVHSSRSGGITSIAFSADSRTLASSSGRTIELWEPHLNKRLYAFSTHLNRITSVAFSADSRTLASGSDKIIELWNWHTGERLRTLSGHSNYIRSVAFSPDGSLLVSGSDDKTIKIWQLFS